MSVDAVIKVERVSKQFKVFLDKGSSLKEKALFSNRRHYEERRVLNDISFSAKKGEVIGIIGENGCGKSTLLKLMSRIMFPDEGTITIKGRVSALIELGAGFHPDMSGRENIYTNAAIFGLTKSEIDARLDDIIRFSELEEYIDNPVRTYSSGMYMRLAFSVAINVDADVLLVDEILAVGDAAFQAKCFNRMREIKAAGTTIIIVSHSLGQVEQICDRTIWICQGHIKKMGVPREVHPQYMEYMGQKQVTAPESPSISKEPGPDAGVEDAESVNIDHEIGNFRVRLNAVCFQSDTGETDTLQCMTGSNMKILFHYKRKDSKVSQAVFGVHIYRNDGIDCYGTNTWIDDAFEIPLQDEGMVALKLKQIPLLQGQYTVDVAVHDHGGETYHHIFKALSFTTLTSRPYPGVVDIAHEWRY